MVFYTILLDFTALDFLQYLRVLPTSAAFAQTFTNFYNCYCNIFVLLHLYSCKSRKLFTFTVMKTACL
jgi:hypothetical protein